MFPTAPAYSPTSPRQDGGTTPKAASGVLPAPNARPQATAPAARPQCVPMPPVEPDWDRIDGDI